MRNVIVFVFKIEAVSNLARTSSSSRVFLQIWMHFYIYICSKSSKLSRLLKVLDSLQFFNAWHVSRVLAATRHLLAWHIIWAYSLVLQKVLTTSVYRGSWETVGRHSSLAQVHWWGDLGESCLDLWADQIQRGSLGGRDPLVNLFARRAGWVCHVIYIVQIHAVLLLHEFNFLFHIMNDNLNFLHTLFIGLLL